MPKNKLEKIHYERFYKVAGEVRNKIWTVTTILEKINKLLPSNLELSETGLRALIGKQHRFKVFRYINCKQGKKTMHYIFRKCLPIEN